MAVTTPRIRNFKPMSLPTLRTFFIATLFLSWCREAAHRVPDQAEALFGPMGDTNPQS
jgi:hypothetical protein